jgi:Flp pilus assembly protein TadG
MLARIQRIVHRFLIREQSGGALVEMALALPIMLMLLTGIFSFSMALYQKLQLSEAISNAGRILALERGNGDPCLDTSNAIYAEAPGLAKSNLTLSFVLGGTNTSGTVTGGTTYTAAKGTAPTCTAAGNGGGAALQAGWPAQIQATYPCTFSIYGASLGSCSIGSKVTEVIQ